MEGAGSTGLALRTGPHLYCNVVTRIPNGHWVAFDCADTGDYYNAYDNFWHHIRYSNGGPVYSGWVSDYYLHDAGSCVGSADPVPVQVAGGWGCSGSDRSAAGADLSGHRASSYLDDPYDGNSRQG